MMLLDDTATPVAVTATLAEPIVDIDRADLMLDSILTWAVTQRAGLTHLPAGQPPDDFPLPLARWQTLDVWGWCTSRGRYNVTRHTAGQIRRKPAAGPMTRFTRDNKLHLSLGAYKARDTAVEAAWVDRVTWQALATDRGHLESLLADIAALGRLKGHGFGRIGSWRVEPSTDPDGWLDRPLPAVDGPRRRVRPPYWHPSERVPCSP